MTCTLDGTPLPACPDSKSVTLPEGFSHTFIARWKRPSRRISRRRCKTISFRILDTVLVSGPPTTSNSKSGGIHGSTGLGHEVRLRRSTTATSRTARARAPTAPAPLTLKDLAEGAHTLRIYAVDGQDADYVPVTRTCSGRHDRYLLSRSPPGADGTLQLHLQRALGPLRVPTRQRSRSHRAQPGSKAQPGPRPASDRRESHRSGRQRQRHRYAHVVDRGARSRPRAACGLPTPPARSAKPAKLATIAGKRKVSAGSARSTSPTVTCPSGATCAITAPKTATVTIAHKRYTVTVTKTNTRVHTQTPSTTAYAKLKGRTGSVKVTIGATPPRARPPPRSP